MNILKFAVSFMVLSVLASSAHAGIIKYNFDGTLTSGPLSGTSVDGYVDVETTLLVPYGSPFSATTVGTPPIILPSSATPLFEFTVGSVTFSNILFSSPSVITLAFETVPGPFDLTYYDLTLVSDGSGEHTLKITNGDITFISGTNSGGGTGTLSAAVPEPSIIALFGAGLLGLGFAHRRRRQG